MKVSFKNVPPDVALVCALAADRFNLANFNNEPGPDEGRETSQHVNYDQSVVVSGTTVWVYGQRNALWGDEHGAAMQALVRARCTPDVYVTSDPRLYWSETLWTYYEKVMDLWGDYTPQQASAGLQPHEHKSLKEAKKFFADRGVWQYTTRD
jgi:hypothetical protein